MRTEVRIQNRLNRKVIAALAEELRPFGGEILLVTQKKHSKAKFQLGDQIRTVVWSSSPKVDDQCIVNAVKRDTRRQLKSLGYLM